MSRLRSLASFAISALISTLICAGSSAVADESKPARADKASAEKPSNPHASGSQSLALQAAAALYQGIETETLPNGLRVYLKPVPGSPVVTTMVGYQVGSADEDKSVTGLAHYLEHLLFKGTAKLMPGQIDRLTLRNGGSNNAFTSEDMTVYHFDFAADRWQVALEIEADRMRNVEIDERHEFEQEKGAVIEELQRNEDQPWDLELKAILPVLFGKEHPYGHPVIGLRKHVRDATAKTIKEYYDRWYYPNNAVLVIVGGFDPNEAKVKIRRMFGSLPQGKLPARTSGIPATRDKPIRLNMGSKFELSRMLAGYNTVPRDHDDYSALTVLDAILSGGKTGRLYKRLVEKEEIAAGVNTGNDSNRHAGWLAVQLEVLQGKDPKLAEKILLEELDRVRSEPVTAAELDRVKQMIVTAEVFGREGVHALADSITKAVLSTNLETLQQELPRIMEVTAEDVQRVAKKYLDPQRRVVVWSIPGYVPMQKSATSNAGAAGGRPKKPANPRRSDREPLASFADYVKDDAVGGATANSGAGQKAPSLRDAKRVELANGLVLLLLENHRLPIVQATAHVRHVSLLEPAEQSGLATLTGALLSEGTTKHTGPEISELIESAGGTLAMSENGGSVGVLSPQRSLGLELLIECLTQATFPKAIFEREQATQLSELADQALQPNKRAAREFRRLVYGKHPLNRSSLGTAESVGPLKREDSERFYKATFVPNNTLLAIVGDFDSDEVVKEIETLTKDWRRGEVKLPELPEVTKPTELTQKIISMPEAAQLHFFLGHVGIRRANPDYYKLLVMDYVLGTGPGFTDRLSSRLRDREGLAYTVMGNISSSASEEPGPFVCYIGTDAANYSKVKAMILEELQRIRVEPATPTEIEDAKQYLLGTLPFQFITTGNIASQLISIERHQLGLSYFDDYRKAVAAVTVEDVQKVAEKYLDPKRVVIVAAGAIDEKGEPLKMK